MSKLGLSILGSCVIFLVLFACGPAAMAASIVSLALIITFPALSPGLAVILSIITCILAIFLVLQLMLVLPRIRRPGQMMG